MGQKHTAGPWRVTQGIDQMADSGTTIYHRDGYGVYSDAETHGDPKADADLIGAADAMFAVLQTIAATLPHIGGNAMSTHSLMAEISAVIAAAQGAAA